MRAHSQLLEDCALYCAATLWPMGYEVSNEAPNSYAELRQQATSGVITVWNGASADTIFTCPSVNYAARAWHDWCHLAAKADFSQQGEATACHVQQEHVKAYAKERHIAGYEVELACRLLDAEVNGQGAFKRLHGLDVVRQREFDIHYVIDPKGALADASYA